MKTGGAQVRKKLSAEVDLEFFQEVKQRALKRNISLRLWILRAIMEQIRKEKQYE